MITKTTAKANESLSITNTTLVNVYSILTEVQTLKASIVSKKSSNDQVVTNAINTLILNYATEAKMDVVIAGKENKRNSLKLELRQVKKDFEKNDEELLLIKGEKL